MPPLHEAMLNPSCSLHPQQDFISPENSSAYKENKQMSLGFTRTPAEHQLRPAYHSLEILVGEAHVVLRYAVIRVDAGIEDEGVIGVYRIVSPILPKSVREYKNGG